MRVPAKKLPTKVPKAMAMASITDVLPDPLRAISTVS
jgi:hypothetical protein